MQAWHIVQSPSIAQLVVFRAHLYLCNVCEGPQLSIHMWIVTAGSNGPTRIAFSPNAPWLNRQNQKEIECRVEKPAKHWTALICCSTALMVMRGCKVVDVADDPAALMGNLSKQ